MKQWLNEIYYRISEHWSWSVNRIFPNLLAVLGFLIAFLAIARLVSERKQPSKTFAWLLAIVFIPYLSVPLFLLIGSSKIRRFTSRKVRLTPIIPGMQPSLLGNPTAKIVMLNGASPPLGGNRVHFTVTGEEAFTELEKNILKARHTIHIMTFILGRDAVGKRIMCLLSQRASEGIKVRLLLDSLGCFPASGRFCDPLRKAGGEVTKFMPILPFQAHGYANLRNHRKIAIFDNRVATVGGHNLAVEYMGPTILKRRWRDFGAVVEGPAANLLNEIFLADWSFASGQPLEQLHSELPINAPTRIGHSHLQVISSGPDVQGEPLYEGILSLIQKSERSIWIVTPYFIPDEVLFRSLLLKAREGIEVRLVVPERSNHQIADLARRHYLRELHRAGARILLYGPFMNHAKLVLVDQSAALWGSANIDLRSLFVNFETAIITYSTADARKLSSWMKEIFVHTKPMSAPEPTQKIFPTIGEEISRLLAPLL